MTLERLGKTLKHELARNKKKSAALGALCIVAAFFWAPLIGKWLGVGSEDEAEIVVNATNSAAQAPVIHNSNVSTSENSTTFRWTELAHWKENQPLMASATLDVNSRSPFDSLNSTASFGATQIVVAPERQHAEAIEAMEQQLAGKEVAPQEILTLTSTIIGRRQRRATINGQTYQELEILVIPSPQTALNNRPNAAIEFQVAEIHADRVVLARNQTLHTLPLFRPELQLRDSLHKSTSLRGTNYETD